MRSLALILALFLCATCARAQDDVTSAITLDPNSGDLNLRDALSASFPTAMVEADRIDAGGLKSPLQFDPPLAGEWLWKSQTEGSFTITGPILPSTNYTARLDSGLRDLRGNPVPPGFSARFETKPFKATTEFEPRTHLRGKPQVVLEFSYAVEISDAAEHIYFQDRDSFARLGAEILLDANDRNNPLYPETTVLRVVPREPLPAGRTYDLILDGVRALPGGKPLAALQRFPLGTTRPLSIEWLGAFNSPRETPVIRVQFSEELVPDSIQPELVRVEPAVPKMRVRNTKDALIIEGEFDVKQRYHVTLLPGLRDISGYTLAAESRWGATFQPKPGAIFFPGPLVHERARSGLNFSFVQVNTGALTWRLAELPVEKLAEVEKRVREFTEPRLDPVTKEALLDARDFPLGKETEIFTQAFGLHEIARGDFPGSGGAQEEMLRTIQWAPPAGGKALGGFYLLEVTGPLRDGDGKRSVGHRSIVCFSDAILTQKRSADAITLRAARMQDGLPIPNASVRLVNRNHFLLASGTTDSGGIVTFPAAALAKFDPKEKGRLFLAETSEGFAVQPFDTTAFNSDYSAPRKNELQLRSVVVTDRNLYRPGHTVKVKGLARLADRFGVIREIPSGEKVEWRLNKEYSSESIANGTASVSAEGGWETEWTIPTDVKLGSYALAVRIGGRDSNNPVPLRIQEYKAPVFEVTAEADEVPVPGTRSVLRVSSRYFSGQPNAGAKLRWRAAWSRSEPGGENGFSVTDEHSENPVRLEEAPLVDGEARLDGEGRVTLSSEAPAVLIGTRYEVNWTVWVTSVDGQTIQPNFIKSPVVMLKPAVLAAKVSEPEGLRGQKRTVKIEADALDKDGKHNSVPANAEVQVFQIGTKVAKEKIAPFVYRYRNTPQYVLLKKASVTLPGSLEVPLAKTGRYVAVVNAPGLRQVSASEIFGGDGEDEVPVRDDSSLEVRDQRPAFAFETKLGREGVQDAGGKIPLLIRAPITGQAWVTVEAEGAVLDSFNVPTNGNNATFDLPLKKEYAPNAFVGVYLVKPGGEKDLPAERFGAVSLTVRRPEWELKITPKFDQPIVKPAELISGTVQVESEGHPVADADLTIFAVDDAVLELGEWKAPDVGALMRPPRTHGVATYLALNEFVSGINPRSLFQKGFVIGGGGMDDAKFVRKDFKALAYWKTGVRTDSSGRATFQFPAPDNLTRFRLVAVAQTKAHQFGLGEATVEIAKPLIVEPALPRFLRENDEVELRAVARLGSPASVPGKVTVQVRPDANLELIGPAQLTADVTKAAPAAFRFRAKVKTGATSARIGFSAATDGNAGQTDDVQIDLVVHPPVLPRRESASGALPAGGGAFAVAEKMPADWRKPGTRGTVSAVVSTSPHLPRLLALQALLDYPHGCLEQQTSKALVHTLMGDLLRTLPPGLAQREPSKEAVESILRLYEKNLTFGGLPYWPRVNDERGTANPFVTIGALWVTQQAESLKCSIPDGLADSLSKPVVKLVQDRRESPFLRAFALLVLSNYEGAPVEPEDYLAVFRERDKLTDEGRALLALALHHAKLYANEKQQLLRELGDLAPKERAFDPRTFCSNDRAFCMGFAAMDAIRPAQWTKEKRDAALARLLKLLDAAPLHSTQENLWALVAFRGVVKGTPANAKLQASKAVTYSLDFASALWPARELPNPAPLALQGVVPANTPTNYLLFADYTVPSDLASNDRRDRGFRLERVVKNLTDATRDGSAAKPYNLNDRLLVTYRIVTSKQSYYVALEDELPAGVENISPDLKMFADTYGVKPDESGRWVDLSYAQRRDQKTQLYFDLLPTGSSTYSVLLRVSSPGSFRWPSASISPMYDLRSGGQSPAQEIVVAAE